MQFHAFDVWKYNQLGVGIGRESSSWVRDINICCPESITLSTRPCTTSLYLKFYQQKEQPAVALSELHWDAYVIVKQEFIQQTVCIFEKKN